MQAYFDGNCTLSEKDRMEDLLSQEKYLIDGYATMIPEANCPVLRQVLTENLNGCLNNQYTVFDKMNQLGWYALKDAPQTEVDAAVQKFSQMQQQLG